MAAATARSGEKREKSSEMRCREVLKKGMLLSVAVFTTFCFSSHGSVVSNSVTFSAERERIGPMYK